MSNCRTKGEPLTSSYHLSLNKFIYYFLSGVFFLLFPSSLFDRTTENVVHVSYEPSKSCFDIERPPHAGQSTEGSNYLNSFDSCEC